MEHGLVTYFQGNAARKNPEKRGIRMWSPELGDFTCDTTKEAQLIRKDMTKVAEALCKSMEAEMHAWTPGDAKLSRRERSHTR